MSAPPAKKVRFTSCSPPRRPAPVSVSKLKPVTICEPQPVPTIVRERFEPPCSLWATVHVETHELIPNTGFFGWTTGRFGNPCRFQTNTVSPLRIVQLGWSVGDISRSESPTTKSYVIRPDTFSISPDASRKHRITHEHAVACGRELASVLLEMCSDLFGAFEKGGRVAGHHFEFDAEIIALELRRAGMDGKADTWEQLAKDGLCTMDPDITQWACRDFLGHAQENNPIWEGDRRPVGLKDVVRSLVPGAHILIGGHHDAGQDAEMTWLVVRELHRLARVSDNRD